MLRDRDNDKRSGSNCAVSYSGGWWHNDCFNAKLTGQHTATRENIGGKSIRYYHGGERGTSGDSWAEAEMLLVPN